MKDIVTMRINSSLHDKENKCTATITVNLEGEISMEDLLNLTNAVKEKMKDSRMWGDWEVGIIEQGGVTISKRALKKTGGS